MTQTQIVKERPLLDLHYRHFDHRIKDIRVIGSWMFGADEDPCLVLMPAKADILKVTPCVVPVMSAWKWAEETGNEFEAATMAIEFCAPLGKNPMSNDDIFQVMWTVRERLHDLIMMPPAPFRPLSIAGHITIKREGVIVDQKDIWDDV